MSDDPADLSKLNDIIVPPDVSWWPLAPGWIILLSLAASATCYYVYRGIQNWKRNAYRREALKQLAAADSPAAIAEILRRTALAVSTREEIAALQGEQWVEWLARGIDSKPSDDVRRSLTQSIYAPKGSDSTPAALKQFAETWISRHHRPC